MLQKALPFTLPSYVGSLSRQTRLNSSLPLLWKKGHPTRQPPVFGCPGRLSYSRASRSNSDERYLRHVNLLTALSSVPGHFTPNSTHLMLRLHYSYITKLCAISDSILQNMSMIGRGAQFCFGTPGILTNVNELVVGPRYRGLFSACFFTHSSAVLLNFDRSC